MKRYTVTGTQPVLGDKMPGETFDGVIPEGEEQFLLGIGAIKIISNDVASDKRIAPESSSDKQATTKKKG